MRNRFIATIFLGSVLLTASAWADQDDMENNADLQQTPEEMAKAAVLRRWPDATEVDAMDMAAEEDGDPKENKADDVDAMPKAGDDDAMANVDIDDDLKPGDKKDEDMPVEMMADLDRPDKDDEGGNWTVSVMFVSGGKKFEALTDDDGKIQYVYETIPKGDAPVNIVDAARDEAKDGELVYVQKELDETKAPSVTTYIVGIGDKDIRVDPEGKVLEVKDAPAQPDEDGDDDDGGRKMKI